MIGDIIYNIIIGPIEMVVELIFSIMHKITENPGISIIGVSLVINFLVLPLYKKSDALQEQERDKQAQMKPWLDHIKKTFKGDERYMMTQEYYRQQGYKPIYALRSMFSLLLQIPFFIAAYHYLSNLEILQGTPFLCFADLGAPDGLIHIGGLTFNLLPILMTLINVISGYIYLRGFPIKDKIQTYGIAVIFLILLYNSPSGLVFYWTLNQVFSVCKNIIMKLLPKREKKIKKPVKALSKKLFFLATIALAVFIGLVIPLTTISSSPLEFISTENSPISLALKTFAVFAGVFVLWFSIFYYLAGDKGKNIFTYFVWAILSMSIIDFFIFGRNYGNMAASFIFDTVPYTGTGERLINIAIIAIACVIICILVKKFNKISVAIGSICIITFVALSGFNIFNIQKTVLSNDAATRETSDEVKPVFNFSKNGKNVVVFMLDRFTGDYTDDIFVWFPNLKESFDGFTLYRNALSYGGCTNISTPSVFGGFDYTPININKRDSESLKDKHNEAISVMPEIFSKLGYSMSLADIPYAGNYEWIPDMSFFDKYKDTQGYVLEGKFTNKLYSKYAAMANGAQERNIIYYCALRSLPAALHTVIYDNGNYLSTKESKIPNMNFLDSYSELKLLKELTNITEDGNTFTMMQNASMHEPTTLDENFEVGESIVPVQENNIQGEYQVHVASLNAVANWLDYLKEQGVYDNTKIVIFGDHGAATGRRPELIDEERGFDVEGFNPCIMVKDFYDTGFAVSDEFMTTADIAYLAVKGIVDEPTNPFTGKLLNMDYKNDDENLIFTTSMNHDTLVNNGNVFDTSDGNWVKLINKNVYNINNYIFLDK